MHVDEVTYTEEEVYGRRDGFAWGGEINRQEEHVGVLPREAPCIYMCPCVEQGFSRMCVLLLLTFQDWYATGLV